MGFRFLKLIVCLLLAGPLASPGWGHTLVGAPARAGAQVLEEWQGVMAENPAVQRSIAYTYDLLSQLKKESRSATATAEAGEINYGLGPTGNRLRRATTTSVGTTPNLPTVVRTTPATGTQTFDANDRSGAPNVYDSAGQALRVDLDGDGTVDQAADSTYDYEGRLVYYRRAAQGPVPTTEVVLVYDGDGNRTRKQVRVLGVNSRNFTKYVVHAQSPTGYAQCLEEWTVSVPDNTSPAYALNRRYYYGARLLRQDRVASAATDYYTYDGLGSVRTLVQLGGSGWTESATYVYDAFGVLIASPTSTANNYQYAGEYWDTDLGLYFLRARYYNPGDGRFLTMDTFQGNQNDPLSLHKYLYVKGNPVNRIDPSGHDGDLISFNISTAISGGLAGGTYGAYSAHRTGGNVWAGAGIGFAGGFVGGGLFGAVPAAVWGTKAGVAVLATFSAISLNSAINYANAGYYDLALMDAAFAFAPLALGQSSPPRVGSLAPELASLSNLEARMWYRNEVGTLDMIVAEMRSNPSSTLEGIAKYASNFRNVVKIKARAYMADQQKAEQLGVSDPILPVEFYIQKAQADGLQGDAVWEKIIADSLRTRTSVNKELGLE